MSIKGPAVLREQNQKKLSHLVRKQNKTSRQDLAKLMGVSKNTISLIVDQFIQEGVIREVGITESRKVGRPKILIELQAGVFKSLGITLSRENIHYMITDYSLNIIEENTERIDSRQVDHVIAYLTKLIQRLLQEHKELIGIGVGIPGIVNTDEGIVYLSTKLGWKDVPLRRLLLEKNIVSASLSLIIQNNVKMTAMCASFTKEIDDDPSFFYTRIGYGVAGAFFQHGQIWDGVSWTSGEIGHISVDANGPQCICGQYGCLEQMISMHAFASWISSFATSPEQKQMDLHLQQYGKYLGNALISVINIMNPSSIVIDSPYNSNLHFKQGLLGHLQANALQIPLSQTNIQFIEQAYVQSFGAAVAVIHHYEH